MAQPDAIADAVLAQSIELSRLEAQGQSEAHDRLAALWVLLLLAMKRHDPTEPRLLAQRLRQVSRVSADVDDAIIEAYSDLAEADAERRLVVAPWYALGVAGSLNALPGPALITRGRSVRALERVAQTSAVFGVAPADLWGRQAATVQQQLADRLRKQVLDEQELKVMLDDATALQQTATRSATTLVQTSLAQVSQEALQQMVSANPETFRGVVWHTTLDNRACPVCIALSGQAWTLDHAPIGESGPWPGEPPRHSLCRCVLVPVLKGQRLPQAQTFEAWLRTRPVAEQQAILGPGRYALWTSGQIQLRQLTDQRHRPLTLSALQSESVAP